MSKENILKEKVEELGRDVDNLKSSLSKEKQRTCMLAKVLLSTLSYWKLNKEVHYNWEDVTIEWILRNVVDP